MLNVKKIITNDYVFSILSRVASVVIGIFHAAFLARFLGPELKGVSASITSIVSVGSVVITGGIHQAFPYYRKNNADISFLDKFCSNILIVYAFLFSFACGAFFILPTDIVVKGSVLLIPLFGYETIINYIFLIEASKKRNVTNIFASLLETLALAVFWIAFAPNEMLMLLGLSIAIVVRAVVSTIKVGFSFSVKHFDFKYLFELAKFGFLPMLALLLTILNSRVDILMLNAYSTIPLAQIGIYSVGVGLAEKALLVPDAIREILLGKLVVGKAEEEVAKACRIGTLVSWLIAVCVMLFGNLAIAILYGAEYSSAYTVTLISSIGTVFMVYIKMISQYNIVYKKQKTNAALLLVSVATNIILNMILIPSMGIVGAAIATLVGHFVCGACFLLFYVKKSKTKIGKLIFVQPADLHMLKMLFVKNKSQVGK